MQTPPKWLKIFVITGIVLGIASVAMAVKVPGSFSLLPLTLVLIMGLIGIFVSRTKKYKCFGGYIISALAAIGIAITLYSTYVKKAEIVNDEKQQEQLEQTNDKIENSDDLDNALDDL